MRIHEVSTPRDEAIYKIRKLQLVSGRTANEIENSKTLINRLMKKYDIKPSDLIVKKPDPLASKIADKSLERKMAAAMMRAEWNKLKSNFVRKNNPKSEGSS